MNEIILDSNVLLRHFLQDIPTQSQKSTAIITEIEKGYKTGFISILVVNEIIWILKRFYQMERKNYIPQIIKILQIPNIKVLEIKKEVLITILEKMKRREVDFTDVYLAEIAMDRTIETFDTDFKKLKN